MGSKGEFAIITASLSAANQNEWIKFIKQRLAEKYPEMKLVAIQPSDGDRDKAFAETQNVLKVYPNVKLVMGIAAPAVPGVAEAVKQSGRTDVKVTGLSLPNMCKPYVKEGIIDSIVLWNTGDLGYLTVYAPMRSAITHSRRETRRSRPGDLTRSKWLATRCDWASLSSLIRAISITSIFDSPVVDRLLRLSVNTGANCL
jgi:rhamnose transport system permease protein